VTKEIQFRRGSTADYISGVGFTGVLAEVTVDTTNNTLRVHDGSTKGGHELVGVSVGQTITNKTFVGVTTADILNVTDKIIGNLEGNADSSTILQNSRNFSISGDVLTGISESFNGSQNVNLSVALSNSFNANTAGIITSTGGFVGNLTGTATTATTATVAQGLTGTPNIEVGIVTATTFFGDLTGTATTATTATVAQGLTGTPDIIVGVITATTYSVSGNSSTVNQTPVAIDASQVQYHSRIASFTANTTVQVSNLTSGRWVQIYIRNTNASARTITVQASTTTTGFANVNLAVSTTAGSASAVSFSLAATSGTAVIWVANINGNIVGSVC
jgi:hypothetical protein